MSRSSGEGTHSSARAQSDRAQSNRSQSNRAQVEPLAALVAVFAVGVALTTYAGVLDATLPTPDRNLAETTVERVEHEIAEQGVVDPEKLSEGLSAGPDGYRVNLTLVAPDETWHAGPTRPTSAGASSADHVTEDAIDTNDATNTEDANDADATDTAEVTVSVRIGPGRIRPGRLRAVVWR